MRWALVFMALIGAVGPSAGQDLSSIERKIAKEPKYASDSPRYALMVLGEKMTKRVWLVWDGDVLYADLNGNGDLTEEGEKISKMEFGEYTPPDGSVDFQIQEIRDGELVHRDLYVSAEPAGRLAESTAEFKTLLKRNPKAYSYRIGGSIEAPGNPGTGVERRKLMLAWVDDQGALQFADRPTDAPIVHFGGKRKLGIFGEYELIAGRSKEVSVGVGTPGIGPGSMAWQEYNDIPKGTPVMADIRYPKATQEAKPIPQMQSMTDRCCTFNLLGQIRAPENSGIGVAQVTFRLDGLANNPIEPATTTIRVAAPKTKIALRPVTKRIVRDFIFGHREAIVGQIQFSPDGNRILAADYPGGMFAVWDVKTANELLQVETGNGGRSSSEFVHVMPDWKTAYVSYDAARKIEQIDVEGKTGIRASYAGSIRGWSLETGEEIAAMRHTPPRGGDFSLVAPNGKWLAAHETIPGEYSREAWGKNMSAISIWDLESKSAKSIGGPGEFPIWISDDSKELVLLSGDRRGLRSIEVETGKEKWTKQFDEDCQGSPICTSSDKNHLVVSVRKWTQKSNTYGGSWLKILDAETGEEKNSHEIDAKLPAVTYPIKNQSGRVLIEVFSMDQSNGQVKSGDRRVFEEQAGTFRELFTVALQRDDSRVEPSSSRMAISPNGKWIATMIGSLPTSRAELLANPSALDLPQPQLWLIEVASGKVVEKLDLPQAIANCVAFAPDGKSIAVTGHGRVHLLDVSDLVKTKE